MKWDVEEMRTAQRRNAIQISGEIRMRAPRLVHSLVEFDLTRDLLDDTSKRCDRVREDTPVKFSVDKYEHHHRNRRDVTSVIFPASSSSCYFFFFSLSLSLPPRLFRSIIATIDNCRSYGVIVYRRTAMVDDDMSEFINLRSWSVYRQMTSRSHNGDN